MSMQMKHVDTKRKKKQLSEIRGAADQLKANWLQ